LKAALERRRSFSKRKEAGALSAIRHILGACDQQVDLTRIAICDAPMSSFAASLGSAIREKRRQQERQKRQQ
jgi:hypothetical protein